MGWIPKCAVQKWTRQGQVRYKRTLWWHARWRHLWWALMRASLPAFSRKEVPSFNVVHLAVFGVVVIVTSWDLLYKISKATALVPPTPLYGGHGSGKKAISHLEWSCCGAPACHACPSCGTVVQSTLASGQIRVKMRKAQIVESVKNFWTISERCKSKSPAQKKHLCSNSAAVKGGRRHAPARSEGLTSLSENGSKTISEAAAPFARFETPVPRPAKSSKTAASPGKALFATL